MLQPRWTVGLGHFIGHRFDVARCIVAGTAVVDESNAWQRKSTISQEKVVVIAVCWPEEDVDSRVVYFNIEVGFGRLLHGGRSRVAPITRTSVVLACILSRSVSNAEP